MQLKRRVKIWLDAVEDKEHAIKNSYHFCLGYKLCRSVIPRGVNKEYGFWVSFYCFLASVLYTRFSM